MKLFDPTWKRNTQDRSYYRHVMCGDGTIETLEIKKSESGGYGIRLWSPWGWLVYGTYVRQGQVKLAQELAEETAEQLGCSLSEGDMKNNANQHARYGNVYLVRNDNTVTGPHQARVTGWGLEREAWTVVENNGERNQYNIVFNTELEAITYILEKIDAKYNDIVEQYKVLNVPPEHFGRSAKMKSIPGSSLAVVEN